MNFLGRLCSSRVQFSGINSLAKASVKYHQPFNQLLLHNPLQASKTNSFKMNKLFVVLLLAAVVAAASAQYYGGYGYSNLGYGYSNLGYSNLGYSSLGYGAYPAYAGYGYGGLAYYKK
ncbi:hypothetical protein Fcan01_27307 [Folsomia candida]|uniref:Uncharacterized protein n=1 Tax=Folsomia candida TaxID=158441 RepID=A0A226CX72_FOLCA|nr:hypothetical protein Fcan01_27307 [Folsomia candida]